MYMSSPLISRTWAGSSHPSHSTFCMKHRQGLQKNCILGIVVQEWIQDSRHNPKADVPHANKPCMLGDLGAKTQNHSKRYSCIFISYIHMVIQLLSPLSFEAIFILTQIRQYHCSCHGYSFLGTSHRMRFSRDWRVCPCQPASYALVEKWRWIPCYLVWFLMV